MDENLILNEIPKETSISPYAIPKLLWSHLEFYFDKKYQVKINRSFSKDQYDGPVITWKILRRTPGRANSPAQSRGYSFSNYTDTSIDGLVTIEKMQIHTVTYEFKITSSSAAEAEQIAWDLENSLLQAAGFVARNEAPGLTFNFISQYPSDNVLGTQQDDVFSISLQYLAQIPILRIESAPQLRIVTVESTVGRSLVEGDRTTRVAASGTIFYPSIPYEDQIVIGIHQVWLLRNDERIPLIQDVDYFVRMNDNRDAYIEWEDEYGLTPAVGEDFNIEYITASRKRYSLPTRQMPSGP